MKETSEVEPSTPPPVHTQNSFLNLLKCTTNRFASFFFLSDWLNLFAAKLFLEGTASAAQIVLAGKGLKRCEELIQLIKKKKICTHWESHFKNVCNAYTAKHQVTAKYLKQTHWLELDGDAEWNGLQSGKQTDYVLHPRACAVMLRFTTASFLCALASGCPDWNVYTEVCGQAAAPSST